MISWYLLLSLGVAFATLLWGARLEKIHVQIERPIPSRFFAVLFFLVFLGSVLRQIFLCRHSFNGLVTVDEYSYGRIYVDALSSFQPIYGGFNQGVMGVALNGWYSIFGPSIESGRAFSAVLGLAGILVYVQAIRRIWSEPLAFCSGAFLCLSTYFSIFSGLALEVVAVFFFPALVLLVFGKGHSKGRNILSGSLMALSFFTYPGVTLYGTALAIGSTLIFPGRVLSFLTKKPLKQLLTGFFPVFALLLLAHRFYDAPPGMYSIQSGSLQGGGQIQLKDWHLIDSLLTNIGDVLLSSNSWYLDRLPGTTFLEQSLWGLFVLGAYFGCKRKDPLLLLIILSSLILFLMNVAISINPGMRRASAALPGIYLLCASGLEELSKRSSFRWRWAFFPALLILPMWNSFRYVPTKLADSPAFFGEPKFSIPDSVLVPALGESNVEISDLLFNIDLERLAMTSTRSLYLKYGKNQSLGQILAWGKSAGCARKMDWKEFPGSRLIGTFEGRPLYAGKKLEGFCEGRAGS